MSLRAEGVAILVVGVFLLEIASSLALLAMTGRGKVTMMGRGSSE